MGELDVSSLEFGESITRRCATLEDRWRLHEKVRPPLERWHLLLLSPFITHVIWLEFYEKWKPCDNTWLLFLSHVVRPPSQSGAPSSLGLSTPFSI